MKKFITTLLVIIGQGVATLALAPTAAAQELGNPYQCSASQPNPCTAGWVKDGDPDPVTCCCGNGVTGDPGHLCVCSVQAYYSSFNPNRFCYRNSACSSHTTNCTQGADLGNVHTFPF